MKKQLARQRLYLDVCTLCRPFDDQRAMRIRLETDAYFLILRAIQDRRYDLVVSPAHRAEIRAMAHSRERFELETLLDRFGSDGAWDLRKVRERAEPLVSKGFGIADAAHAAFAEAGADHFVTCDDKLLKRCKAKGVNVRTLNPIEFCISEDLR